MVMHARKLPRIDDGYTDKREAQSYQSSQYPSKTGYSNHSDRCERYPSPGINSTPSRESPRYINKSAYIERAKERHERGMETSPGKKNNQGNNVPGSNNGDHSNSGNHDIKPSTAKTSSNPKDKSEVQKSAIRTFGEWSEHLSSTGKKYYYNCRTEVSQWEKPREWNDVATSRTERQSTDSRASNDKQNSKENKIRHTSGSIEKREKHLGDVRHMVADSNPKPDKMYLFEKLQQSQKKLQDEMRANQHPYSEQADPQRRTDNNSVSSDFSNGTGFVRKRRDSEGAWTLARQTPRNDIDEVESPGSTPTTSQMSVNMPQTPVSNISTANLNIANIPNLITQLSVGQTNQDHVHKAIQTLQKLQQALTRQIAAHQSSVANQPSQSTTVQALPRQQPHTTSHQHYKESVSSSSAQQQQQHLYQQQQIQSQQIVATSVQQTSQVTSQRSPYMNSQNSIPQSHPTSPHPALIPLATNISPVSKTATSTTTIPITQSGNQVHRGNIVYGKFLGSQNRTVTPSYQLPVEEKVSDSQGGDAGERNDLTPCCSPTPSDTSSQGASVDPSMFASETMGQRDNNLMTTLHQFYNVNSVSHVTGWQGEIAERQARVYGDEGLKVGSLIGSQISVELKRARSLVRVEEIQATLREQRILFLEQYIAELEGMRSVSSVSSYLPLSSSSGT